MLFFLDCVLEPKSQNYLSWNRQICTILNKRENFNIQKYFFAYTRTLCSLVNKHENSHTRRALMVLNWYVNMATLAQQKSTDFELKPSLTFFIFQKKIIGIFWSSARERVVTLQLPKLHKPLHQLQINNNQITTETLNDKQHFTRNYVKILGSKSQNVTIFRAEIKSTQWNGILHTTLEIRNDTN